MRASKCIRTCCGINKERLYDRLFTSFQLSECARNNVEYAKCKVHLNCLKNLCEDFVLWPRLDCKGMCT